MLPYAMSVNADGNGSGDGLSPMLLASIVILILFVMISIAMFIYSSQLRVNIIEERFERKEDMDGLTVESASATTGSVFDSVSGKHGIESENVIKESGGTDAVDYLPDLQRNIV